MAQVRLDARWLGFVRTVEQAPFPFQVSPRRGPSRSAVRGFAVRHANELRVAGECFMLLVLQEERHVADIVPSTNFDNFTVSLSVRHPSIDPQEITRTLGFEPQHSWKAGEVRRTAHGQPLEGTYHESYWTGEFRELDSSLRGVVEIEAVLLAAVAHLRRSQPFLSRLQAEGATVELFIEIVGGTEFTFSLSPQLLSMLSRSGFSVMLKMHSEAVAVADRRKAG